MINTNELSKYSNDSVVEGGVLAQSVHYGQTKRFEEARKQLAGPSLPANNTKLLELLNEILEYLGVSLKAEEVRPPYDSKYDKGYVWIKIAHDPKSGKRYGRVVANGPVNFEIPNDKSNYHLKNHKGQWKYPISGVWVHDSELEWDTEQIIAIPIGNVPVNVAKFYIGNFLLENGIPIIDKFSHRYFAAAARKWINKQKP